VREPDTIRLDLEAARERKIPVCNMPGITAQSVAEHAMYLLLALARNDREYGQEMKKGKWNRGVGVELAGKNSWLNRIRQYCQDNGKDRSWFWNESNSMQEKQGERELRAFDFVDIVDFDYLLEESDIVSIHIPLIKHGSYRTEGLIGKKELEKIGGAGLGWLINTSRGSIIDERALIES
jgi:D-3-phosphoglycerate dehydrogenase